jgi:hypothetical protein
MNSIHDYIVKRIGELEDSLLPLRHQSKEITAKIDAIEKELADLRAAAKAIGMVNRLPKVPFHVTRRTEPEVTIKEAVMNVLADYPEGLIALDILGKVNERFDLGLVRTSLSPQLTRLKREGKITNHGSVWLPTLFLHTDKNNK